MKRETVGKYAYDLLQKEPEIIDPIEHQREMQKDYLDELWICIDVHKKRFPKDFFVVVLTKRVGYMVNVLRNYFYGRVTCPTPEYDQAVFKYSRSNDAVEFVWQVPSQDTCLFLIENESIIPLEHEELLGFAKAFEGGVLLEHAKKLNKEHKSSSKIDTV